MDEKYTLHLPAITDRDPDDMPVVKSVSFSGNGKDFMTFVNSSQTIEVRPSNESHFVGEYTITISVDDLRDKPLENTYTLTILVKAIPMPETAQNKTKESQPNPSTTHSKPSQKVNQQEPGKITQTNSSAHVLDGLVKLPDILVEWRVESISLKGQVKVVFTQDLDTDRLNLVAIN